MSYKYCCDEFADARMGDPANDLKPIYPYDGKWRLVADCWSIKHCPFCGVELRPPPPERFTEAELANIQKAESWAEPKGQGARVGDTDYG